MDCLSRLGRSDGTSSYLRLSTRPVRQELAAIPADPAARERRRRHVVAGGYVLSSTDKPDVTLVTRPASRYGGFVEGPIRFAIPPSSENVGYGRPP